MALAVLASHQPSIVQIEARLSPDRTGRAPHDSPYSRSLGKPTEETTMFTAVEVRAPSGYRPSPRSGCGERPTDPAAGWIHTRVFSQKTISPRSSLQTGLGRNSSWCLMSEMGSSQ